jgi:hypothetical protein
VCVAAAAAALCGAFLDIDFGLSFSRVVSLSCLFVSTTSSGKKSRKIYDGNKVLKQQQQQQTSSTYGMDEISSFEMFGSACLLLGVWLCLSFILCVTRH